MYFFYRLRHGQIVQDIIIVKLLLTLACCLLYQVWLDIFHASQNIVDVRLLTLNVYFVVLMLSWKIQGQ